MTAELGIQSKGEGVFTGLPRPWKGIEMKCPNCDENTPDRWTPFWPGSRLHMDEDTSQYWKESPPIIPLAENRSLQVDYMWCANEACRQVVIRLHESEVKPSEFLEEEAESQTTSWMIYPRHSIRRVDPLVPEKIRRDYEEAAAILDFSSRMSSVLSRRILAELLEDYAGISEYHISAQIDKFVDDPRYP